MNQNESANWRTELIQMATDSCICSAFATHRHGAARRGNGGTRGKGKALQGSQQAIYQP